MPGLDDLDILDIDNIKNDFDFIVQENAFSNSNVFEYMGEFLQYAIKNDDRQLRPQYDEDFENALPVINAIYSIFEDYCENTDMKRLNSLINKLAEGDIRVLTKEELYSDRGDSYSEKIEQFVYCCNEKLIDKDKKILELRSRIEELNRQLKEARAGIPEKPQSAPVFSPAVSVQPEKQEEYREQQFAENEILYVNVSTDYHIIDRLNEDAAFRSTVKKLVCTGDYDCLPRLYNFKNLTELEIGRGIVNIMSDSISDCPSLKLIKVTEPRCHAEFQYDMPFAINSTPECIIASKGSSFENIARVCQIKLKNID